MFNRRHKQTEATIANEPLTDEQTDNTDGANRFMQLQHQIEEAEKCGQSIVPLVRQQIRQLERSHDQFITMVLSKGYSLSNPRIGEIEVQQYVAMKQLAKKIGDTTEKYDTLIRNVRVRIFGEENTQRFFDEKNEG